MNPYQQPEMIMVCGSNGSGKSTLTYELQQVRSDQLPFIDPDRILKEENCSPIEAGRIVINRLENYLKEKRSFVRESTLSSNFDFSVIRKAKENGYHVSMVYVGVNDVNAVIKRIDQRYRSGGHFVPTKDVIRRYQRSLENLPKAISEVDLVMIFDNSEKEYKEIAEFEKGKLKFLKVIPKWFKQPLEKIQEQQNKKQLSRSRKRFSGLER